MTAAPTHRASDLARRFGLELRGADVEVRGVATLADAARDQLTFLANPRYRSMLRSCGAGVVVVGEADAAGVDRTLLVAPDPYVAFARVAALFEARTPLRPGIHPSAVVDPDAEVDPGAEVGPQVVIGARSSVASGARLGPGCVVGEDCRIGADCELVARVTLVSRVVVGARVRIHPGAVIGAAGFGLAMDAGQWVNVPQLGGVRIGEDCEIGANTTIDRGALGDTVIEDDVRLDNQIQIGHNVRIGAHTAMAGCSAVAGSARIGRYCLIGGGAGILGHLEICDRVTITAMSLVTRSIAEPGEYSSGVPLQDNRSWRRNAARFKKLDDMARKIDRAAKETPDP